MKEVEKVTHLPDGSFLVEISFMDEEPLPEGAEFLGFCTPCGGLRKHRLGCPIKRMLDELRSMRSS